MRLRTAAGAGMELICAPAAMEWVREYFGPALREAEAPGAPRITATEDGEALAELRREMPPEAGDRGFFAWDQQVVALPAWEEGGRLLGLDERGAIVAVSPGEISVIADPGSLRWRWTLVITIKEALCSRLRGSLLESHAAAVEIGGRAVVLVGPKGAGKTTLTFHLMKATGSPSISNDRVFLGLEEGEPTALGMPSALRVKRGVEAEFPELRAGLPARERHYLYTEAELPGPPLPSGDPTDELIIGPAQMARLLGAPRAAGAPVGTVLFPEVDPAATGWQLEELEPEAIARRLRENLFGGSTRPRPATVFELEAGTSGEPPPQLAEELGSTVRGLRIVLGRGAYEGEAFPRALLAEIAPWA